MPSKGKDRKTEAPIPEPKSAKQLAQALFAGADRKLPPDKRRFTKSLIQSDKTEDQGN